MAVLLDTSFLLAVASPRDANHEVARAAMRDLVDSRIVVASVLPEIFYMVANRVNYATAIRLFATLHSSAFQSEALTESDMARMQTIMTEYQDNAFDFVDVSIMAVAERLNVQRIYTLDRRDFTVFRPNHCSHLILLP